MEHLTPTSQDYNGGIIFASYLISVVGAMTTLELLQRRTHINGKYNWFLLSAAAGSMGSVGIWCMHFIGNNSLSIILKDGSHHPLSYSAGFTFISLVVAVLVMFLAFVFVGITEEAKMIRILPSGFIAGLGIVSMHYLGQVAIDFFTLKNKLAYVVCACLIAICAATVALFIFFKLREQWENQWYKRLGCAMIMGLAVCGMHYTALLGTAYYVGDSTSGPPTPVVATPALIGIISAIVSLSCLLFCVVLTRSKLEAIKAVFKKEKSKRLILDVVFFDANGRILVTSDGIVPMKEVLTRLPENKEYDLFSVSHPLFIRLSNTALKWSNGDNHDEYEHQPTITNTQSRDTTYDTEADAFENAASELVQNLRLSHLSDLGYLFDSVLSTNIISKKQTPFFQKNSHKSRERESSVAGSWPLSSKSSKKPLNTSYEVLPTAKHKSQGSDSTASLHESVTVIDIFSESNTVEMNTISNNLSVNQTEGEDKHIFLVKKIENNKDLVKLLALGFRFAEPMFISKTMGEKLSIPSEYFLSYFRDMLQLSETLSQLYNPIKLPEYPSYSSIAYNQYVEKNNNQIRGGVFVGLLAVTEDSNDPHKSPHIIVDKFKRNSFPLVQLTLNSGKDDSQKSTELTKDQKNLVLALTGQTLSFISTISSSTVIQTDNIHSSIFSEEPQNSQARPDTSIINNSVTLSDTHPNENGTIPLDNLTFSNSNNTLDQFKNALQKAAKDLIGMSSYGNLLASFAKLHGDIIDAPAFSLRAGPCQVILFQAYTQTSETQLAVNRTLSENIKCIPYSLYQSYTFHITNKAMELYKQEQNKLKTPSSYLAQQRLYQSSAARDEDLGVNQDQEDPCEPNQNMSQVLTVSANLLSPNSAVQNLAFPSLSPPPRVKRNKITIPTSLTSLDINSINKKFIPNIIKSANSFTHNPSTSSSSIEVPLVLTLLPLKERFWWLEKVYEEICQI